MKGFLSLVALRGKPGWDEREEVELLFIRRSDHQRSGPDADSGHLAPPWLRTKDLDGGDRAPVI